MQIRFLRDGNVQLATVPKSQWGRLLPNFAASVPSFSAETGPELVTAAPETSHRFPAGTIADLPEPMAMAFIADGTAKPSDVEPVLSIDRDELSAEEITALEAMAARLT